MADESLGTAQVEITANLAPLEGKMAEARSIVEQGARAAAGASTAEFQKGFSQIETDAGKMLSGITDSFRNLISVFGIGFGIREIISVIEEGENAQAKLAGVLRATGDASGYSAAQLEHMAVGLEQTSTFSKAAIENGIALGLTFTGISREVFPRFVQDSLNIAALYGKDLPSAFEQLGRALQNHQLTMLERQGIISAAAAAEVKALDDLGKHAEATTLILTSVEHGTNNMASAMRETLGGALSALGHGLEDAIEKFSSSTGLTWAITGATNALSHFFWTAAHGDELVGVEADIDRFKKKLADLSAEKPSLFFGSGDIADAIASNKLALDIAEKRAAVLKASEGAGSTAPHTAPFVDPKSAEEAFAATKKQTDELAKLREETTKYIGELHLRADEEQILLKAQQGGGGESSMRAAQEQVAVMENLHRLNASATQADRDAVARYTTEIFNEKNAVHDLAEEQKKATDAQREAQTKINDLIASSLPRQDEYREKIQEIVNAIEAGMVPNINLAEEAIANLQREEANAAEGAHTFAAAMESALNSTTSKFVDAIDGTDALGAGMERVRGHMRGASRDAQTMGAEMEKVFLGLAKDIEKIVLERTVINPLLNAFSGAVPGQKDYLPTFGNAGNAPAGSAGPAASSGGGALGSLEATGAEWLKKGWDALASDVTPIVKTFSSMWQSLSTDSTTISSIENLFGSAFQGLGSLIGGGLSSAASGLGSLFGFASGGSFDVSGSGGTDSSLVAFRATPGEHVQVGGGGGGGGVGPAMMTNVQVHNYSGQEAKVSQRSNGNGGTDIVMQIGDAMAHNVRTGGAISRAVRDTFGANRTPIQR